MLSDTINVDRAFLEELLDFKLRNLNQEIDSIISKWRYVDANLFLSDTRNGKLKNAEIDAILLRQLISDRDELLTKKTEFKVA
jgi:hypothetical protein